MVAKIGRGNHLKGALIYNYQKVGNNKGNVLFCHNMIEPLDGRFTVPLLEKSFEPYLAANKRTEKPVLHISLNPNPKDRVSDRKFQQLAEGYMKEMGYGDQPFVVFKHTDIERAHIHIVSTCIDENGKRISDSFERRRSMKACRNLEKQFKLTPAVGTSKKQEDIPLQKVDATRANIKKQMASVLSFVNENYHFQTPGEYNALLSFFHMTSEEVRGMIHGKEKRGLVYFASDSAGKKASNPFKSSRFSGGFGLADLQRKMEKSKTFMQQNKPQKQVRELVHRALQYCKNREDFNTYLQNHKVSTFIRENEQGRIYGISFIDHNSKTVLNGSRLGKAYSANVFHSWWKEGVSPVPASIPERDEPNRDEQVLEDIPTAGSSNPSYIHAWETLGGLLPIDIPEANDNYILKKKQKKKKKCKTKMI